MSLANQPISPLPQQSTPNPGSNVQPAGNLNENSQLTILIKGLRTLPTASMSQHSLYCQLQISPDNIVRISSDSSSMNPQWNLYFTGRVSNESQTITVNIFDHNINSTDVNFLTFSIPFNTLTSKFTDYRSRVGHYELVYCASKRDLTFQEFTFPEGSNQFHGIIDHFSQTHDQSIHLETSAVPCDNSSFQDLIDSTRRHFFMTATQSPFWIQYNFPRLIRIKSYVIIPPLAIQPIGIIANWALSISKDRTNWTEIHRVTNYQGLNHPVVFSVDANVFSCQYVRLTVNGPNSLSQRKTCVGFIDFSGYMYE